MKRLNLEDVGRLAGVSRSTVSRVINGEPNVSEDAARRVQSVISDTGYRSHAAARSLASNRTGVFGLVIPSAVETLFDDPYFGRLILGASAATNSLGKTLALFLFNQGSDEESIGLRVVNPGLVDGVIVTATQMNDPLIEHLRSAAMPFVVVGRPDDTSRALSVDADNRGGARTAALHLAGLGRSRIGIITPPLDTAAGIDRREGFLQGMSDAGVSAEVSEAVGYWTEDSGRLAMESLLANEVDAVFVGSDRMALGALRAISDASLRCPDDVAVVSFDGILPADQTNPRLTTIRQPVREVGERAVGLLEQVVAGSATTPESIVFPVELLIRESCGAVDVQENS